MSGAAAGGAGAAAAAAAIARAIKASGAIVELEASEFQKVLHRSEDGVVVHALGGFLRRDHRYLTSYRGLFFYTKSQRQIPLPGTCEMIESKKIWIP